MSSGQVGTQLKSHLQQAARELLDAGFVLHECADAMRREVIAEALARTKRNQSRVASGLGIHRNTLGREIHRLALREVLHGPRKGSQSERNVPLRLRKAG